MHRFRPADSRPHRLVVDFSRLAGDALHRVGVLVPGLPLPTPSSCQASWNGGGTALVVSTGVAVGVVTPPADDGGGGGGGGASSASLSCRTVLLGPDTFSADNPVVQARWHPHSDRHVMVLSRDGLRLFRCDTAARASEVRPSLHMGALMDRSVDSWDPATPASTWHSRAATGHDPVAFVAEAEQNFKLPLTLAPPAAFAFGGARHWERFAVYVMLDDGELFVILPVFPYDTALPADARQDVLDFTRQRIVAAEKRGLGDVTLRRGGASRVAWLRFCVCLSVSVSVCAPVSVCLSVCVSLCVFYLFPHPSTCVRACHSWRRTAHVRHQHAVAGRHVGRGPCQCVVAQLWLPVV